MMNPSFDRDMSPNSTGSSQTKNTALPPRGEGVMQHPGGYATPCGSSASPQFGILFAESGGGKQVTPLSVFYHARHSIETEIDLCHRHRTEK